MIMDIIASLWDFNISLYYLINLNMQNPVFNFLMPLITFFGRIFVWVIFFVLLFIFGGTKGKKTAILGFLILLITTILVVLIKNFVAEPRPFITLANVHLLEIVKTTSFPSAHSTTSFAVLVLLGKKYGYIYLFIALATLITFSRVYIGVHYPFDVIFGAILGTVCTLIILKYENQILQNKYLSKIIPSDNQELK